MNKFVKLALPANIDGRQRYPGDAGARADGYIEVSAAEAKRLAAAGVLAVDPIGLNDATPKEQEPDEKAEEETETPAKGKRGR